jgi:hypothetical protein
MSIAYRNKRINSYFRLMKNWDTESKKDLIIKLTKSIHDRNEAKYDFSSCFGAWDDERSADEIIKEIRNSRVNNREIEDF